MTQSTSIASPAYQAINIDRIVSDPLNPRKDFDEARLSELAASIAVDGILQPIVVRPEPGTKKLKIVMGERRYRAARIAGLSRIDCRVVEMDDATYLRLAYVENIQREDLSVLEQCNHITYLVDQMGMTVEQIAADVGKSVSSIRAILKLKDLPDEAELALAKGEISPAVAGLIAACPSWDTRNKVAKFALQKCDGYGYLNSNGTLPSFRLVKDWKAKHCMIELKQALFDPKDAKLIETAGSCQKCPKRTGNNREDYPEGRADICTDPDCFNDKQQVWKNQQAKDATAAGFNVISPEVAKNIFPYGGYLVDHCEYYDLDKPCLADKEPAEPRTYRKLVGKLLARDQIWFCLDGDGQPHHLAAKAIVNPKLKRLHKIDGESSRNTRNGRADEKERERAKEEKRKKRALVDEFYRAMLTSTQSFKAPAAAESILRIHARETVYQMWGQILDIICRARGLGGKNGTEKKAALQALLEVANVHELICFFAELEAVRMTAIGKDGDLAKWTRELGGGKPAAADPPAKKKRGRPRKEAAHAQ